MRTIVVSLLAVFFCFQGLAQKLEWAGLVLGSRPLGLAPCSAGDANGATYIGGLFKDSFNTNLFAGTLLNLSTTNPFGAAYFTKYDSNGVVQYSKTFLSSGGPSQILNIEATNSSVIICGSYYGNCIYDSNGSIATLPAYPVFTPNNYESAAFIAKYTLGGVLLWIKHFKPTQTTNWQSNFVTTTNPKNQNIGCLIAYRDSINFMGVTYDIALQKGFHQLLTELDSNGNVISTMLLKQAKFNGNYYYHNQMKWTAKNELYLTGHFVDTLDFIKAGIVTRLTNPTKNAACFVAKFDSVLSVIKINSFGQAQSTDSSQHNYIFDIVIDTTTNSYTIFGGFSSKEFGFDNSGDSSYILSPRYGNEAILVKYDSTGKALWLKRLFDCAVYGHNNFWPKMTTANNGDLIVRATIGITCDLDPTEGVQYNTNPLNLNYNSTIIKYSDTGRLLWHQSINCPFITEALGIHTDLNDNIYMTSRLFLNATSNKFDANMSTSDTIILAIHPSKISILIEKLKPCTQEQGQLPIQSCAPFLLPSGQKIFADGTYPFSSLDSEACLTNYTYVVDIVETDTTVLQNGASFQTANPNTQYQYQWLNCNTNSLIAGATGSNFTATENGAYAVIVNNGVCVDTSACISLNNLSLNSSNANALGISKIASNKFLINKNLSAADIMCYDVLGAKIPFNIASKGASTEITVLHHSGLVMVQAGGVMGKVVVW
jgi:hypothetical protein